MHLKIGNNGRLVTAPIAPGIIETVSVKDMQLMAAGESAGINFTPSVVALDGEREVEIRKGQQAAIRLSVHGPLVVDVERTMVFAMERKIFAS